jgi:hypothetical protein
MNPDRSAVKQHDHVITFLRCREQLKRFCSRPAFHLSGQIETTSMRSAVDAAIGSGQGLIFMRTSQVQRSVLISA